MSKSEIFPIKIVFVCGCFLICLCSSRWHVSRGVTKSTWDMRLCNTKDDHQDHLNHLNKKKFGPPRRLERLHWPVYYDRWPVGRTGSAGQTPSAVQQFSLDLFGQSFVFSLFNSSFGGGPHFWAHLSCNLKSTYTLFEIVDKNPQQSRMQAKSTSDAGPEKLKSPPLAWHGYDDVWCL